MASPPVRTTTLRNHLRETTGLRISTDATAVLVELLENQISTIATRAMEKATADERTTLMKEDIEAAFEDFLKMTGPSLLSAPALHVAINQLDTQTLTQLVQLLRQELRNP